MNFSSLALASAIATAFMPSFGMACSCQCTNPFTFLHLCDNCLDLQCEVEPDPAGVPHDHCWEPRPITCPSKSANKPFNVYQGTTVDASDESSSLDKCFGHFPGATNQRGVWFKFSVGADPLLLKLDACGGQTTNWNARVTIYEGTCAEGTTDPGSELTCYPALYTNPLSSCKLEAAFTGSFPDKDYLILVEGVDINNWLFPGGGEGTFDLEVACSDVPGPFLDPLGTIDRWYIQRSSAPAPDITMFDPIVGSHWLELHESQYTNIPCTGSECPETQNNGVMVKQEFTIPDPYNVMPNIYTAPPPNGGYATFSFCIHSELVFDYNKNTPHVDTVSYFDTYYNVLVDYEADMIVCVAASERNPGQVDDLFDGFRVEAYTCHDGDPVPGDKNDPVLPYYLVGETYRICVKPIAEFAEAYDVVEFSGDIKCYNDAGTRLVIDNGTVVYPELSSIDDTDIHEPLSILAFTDTVTDNFLPPNSGGEEVFRCEGPVKLAPKALAGRRLQEGEAIPDDELLTGTFNIQLTITQPGKLSTGAIVGISIAGFAAFLVALLILYRRGCFDKRNNNHKNQPSKTVTVEESSETSGDDNA
ncbi:hypothetical protein IV203_004915 [Nitzschia inconspicua]|uniref:Uncharacterized protein n=1 Tax=Nitzschia inconspicua TaxID=303405 RepID=A0A9K3KLG0_9STRA|nr:hypothetical protein IV203_004915 [Nitzschia inconspicua]